MVELDLGNAFDALDLSQEPFFYPRPGSEDTRGSETHKFYVVFVGRVPGVYTHWEEAAAQVVSFSNAVYKKHAGWSAAVGAWNARRQILSELHPRAVHTTLSEPQSRAVPTAPSKPSTRKIVRHVKIEASTSAPKHAAASTPGSARPVSSAPSTPTGSRKPIFVYSRGKETTIYADQRQASAAARRGLADGSFGKVEVTSSVDTAFDLAAESALAVVDISDTESN
ncbi:hypothetical protein MSAN_02532000 [Mycena sanguinolenta]|uniref:Ribonuclease H1 N-terminal domain-containing protein n=1 Tax=Mycena sanguinolenta TaxID=230812 RepID=A0A8H6TS10_9AGAR|nr:hypothetical protein MSAN_02532000 [Mycena sanguinolenta]